MKNSLKLLFLSIAFTLPITGCYGKFALVRTVYNFNGSFEDKFIRSIFTWIFVWIPVYGLASFGDFFIFNVIEFWTGENPINSGRVKSAEADGSSITAEVSEDSSVLEFKLTKPGFPDRLIHVRRADEALAVTIMDENGARLAEEVFPMDQMSAEQIAALADHR